MEAPIAAALIAGSVASVGWVVNHVLASRQAERRRVIEARLKFVERQLEELYGPLVLLVLEGKRAFIDLLEVLGRNYVFDGANPLPPKELETWLFWAESEFMPRNSAIIELLRRKAHLVEGERLPESYEAFLEHANSWSVLHRRWKEKGVPYAWHSKVNWPAAFESAILDVFASLKQQHAALVGAFTGKSLANLPKPRPPLLASETGDPGPGAPCT